MFFRNGFIVIVAVTCISLISISGVIHAGEELAGKNEALQQVPPPPESSKWPMYLPAITSSGPKAFWSALTWAKCAPPDTLTFTVTIDGVTKKSVIKPTDLDGTREGWVATESGNKTVTWTAKGCGTFAGWGDTMKQNMIAGKKYTFNLYPDQYGQPYVKVTE